MQRDASSEWLQTAHGARKSTALADGSVMELNTDTEARIDMTGPERRVVLVKGEAYFDVAKDPNRPFVVKAGNAEIRVFGTQFSVRERAGAVEVVVAHGRVKVTEVGLLAAKADPIEVTPGSQLVLSGSVRKVSAVDAQRATAWRTGTIEFDGLTLEQVVAEINRYSDTPITFADDGLRGQRMSGRVRTGDLDAFRFMLKEQFGIECVERSGRITLSRS